MRILAVILILVGLSLSQVNKESIHSSTMRFANEDGVCAATAIGPQVILTAQHCLGEGEQKLNGVVYDIIDGIKDHNDHVMLAVSGPEFKHYAEVDLTPLKQGDKIYIWGEPNGYNDIYAEGYVAGFLKQEVGPDIILLDIKGYFGDSGAGVFDASGKLRAIITTFRESDDHVLHFMGAVPLKFDPEVIQQAKKLHIVNGEISIE